MVAFTLRADVSRDDPRALAAAKITAGHPRVIPEIQHWMCGWDESRRDDAADFLLVSGFASSDDYNVFRTHPDHERGKAAWRQIATWQVADVSEISGLSW